MKVRIGLGIGAWPFPERGVQGILDFIDSCEELGIDSLWFSDRIIGATHTLEPTTLMAFMAARAPTMKLGTGVMVLPARHPVVLAKELATLDYLSRGRLLLGVGLGSETSQDLAATGVPTRERGARTDEAIVLMRLLWSGEPVTFKGRFYAVEEAVVHPVPVQKPGPPIWIGGRSQGALRRVGHLGDGWLVSGATPQEVSDGIRSIHGYAAEADREVPEDHFGVSLPFCLADDVAQAERLAGPRLRRSRADLPAAATCALGTPEQVLARVEEYVAAGATKFVLRPACPPELWDQQVERLAREVIAPVQTPFSEAELAQRRGEPAPAGSSSHSVPER